MSLTGKNNEEKIWNFLTGKGLNSYGAAGLMGNLFAESGLNPHNLQNTYEKTRLYRRRLHRRGGLRKVYRLRA